MTGPMNLFCSFDGCLSIASVSMPWHDPDGGYPFSAAVFPVDYSYSAYIIIPGCNEIIRCPRLLITFCPQHCIISQLTYRTSGYSLSSFSANASISRSSKYNSQELFSGMISRPRNSFQIFHPAGPVLPSGSCFPHCPGSS